MLKLTPDPTFKAPVSITIPGELKTGSITFTFKYRSRSEMQELFKRAKSLSSVESFREVVIDWDWPGVELTDENIEKFLNNYPASTTEIATAYQKLSLESRVKN
jgi:hypothetical protein